MRRQFIMFITFVMFAIGAFAQEVYVLNAHSQLEPAKRVIPSGTKLKGNMFLDSSQALLFDGKYADLTLPLGTTLFYIRNSKNSSLKSWKLASVKSKKNNRELDFAKMGLSGVKLDVDEIDLEYEKLSDEIYLIKPKQTLLKGEYVLFKMEMSMLSGAPDEMYDFRVDPSLSPLSQIPDNELILAELDKNQKTLDVMDENRKDVLIVGSSVPLSDVDKDIPLTKKVADNTFALIISNENYKQVESVPFALNDGRVFKQYLKLAIGLPDKHITHLENASLSDLKYALNRLVEICDAYEGEAKIIVYYSGHGIPSENSKEGYILPVDGYVSDVTTALKVSDLYNQLSVMNSKSTILFLDACFTGSQKGENMLASARGVAIRVKKEKPMGNLIVMSAAQGDQTAYPYPEKQHGLMTYFLLKKLQETKGEATLGELSDYVIKNVKRISLVEQGKSQIPTVDFDLSNEKWREQTLQQ